MKQHDVDIAVIGAGIVGIATAYFLATKHRHARLLIVDIGQPMTLTSAHSGENYRNWWPHPVMTAFTDHSIGLLEAIARRTDNRLHMTRRGYLLATRQTKPEALLRQLYAGYGAAAEDAIRIHDGNGAKSYQPPLAAAWEQSPDGVDVLLDGGLIGKHYPELDAEIATIVHIRRAGDISGQQLGQFMLEEIRAAGGRFQQGRVRAIAVRDTFELEIETNGERATVRAGKIVNAAGPFAAQIAAMHGETLPIINVLQQKIAFADRQGAVSRQMPFAIDLDGQTIAWTAAEREALADDPDMGEFLRPMPGSMHCRPDGGERGQWIKLGWAYNGTPSEPMREPELDAKFPEIVLRAASRLLPRLKAYIGLLPRDLSHYGGYYTMTAENWPLIGAAQTPGVFLVAALSGYGTMSACAAGDLCARAIVGAPVPAFAKSLAPSRYQDHKLMAQLASTTSRGLL